MHGVFLDLNLFISDEARIYSKQYVLLDKALYKALSRGATTH